MIASSSQPGQMATAFGVHRAMDTAGAMLGPLLAVAMLTVVHLRDTTRFSSSVSASPLSVWP